VSGPWDNYAQTAQAGPWAKYAMQAPSRDELSQQFYAAKAQGREDDARAIIGYIQRNGMTLAPMNPEQVNAGLQKVNAENVAAQNPIQTAAQGFGKSFVDTGRGLGELVGLVKPQDVAESRRLDSALMNSTAGQIGHGAGIAAQVAGGAAAGGIAAGAPALAGLTAAEAPTLAGSLAGGVLTGAAYGDIAPYATTGEHVANIATGALAGPVLRGAVGGARLLGRGGKSLIQRYVAPDAVAATRVGRALAEDNAVPSAIRNGADAVPGVKPTLAQVLQTPKAVQLERAARNNPISGPEMAARDLENSAARTNTLQQHVLTPADELAARRTRKANFAPAMESVNDAGFIDVGPLRFEAANLAQRGNNAMTRSAAKKILSFIDDNTAKVGEHEGMIPVADLHTLQHDLGTIVKQANPEAINTAQALHELQPFKNAIVETVDSLAPGYKAALQQYAKDSAPIRTSQTIGDLLNPTKATATDLTGEPTITAARIKSVLSKDDRGPFKMTPRARKDVESVQSSLQSRNAAQRSIGPVGSPTEENRLNQLVNSGARHIGAGVGGAVGFGAGGPAGSVAGALLGHGADMLDRYAQNRIAGSVGRLLMDPNASANALDRYLILQGRRQALDDLLSPVAQYGGVGSVAGLLASPARAGGGQ
jgi:hypothetical protein